MNNQINLQSLGCKPDKKVPTHGPGTIAYYRGKQCKILSIKNGKAKIFCDGAVLIVNYTSIDDAMYGTMKKLKESEMAFGIGSQVIYKNTTCKITSISNGLCKLFADGKVIATDVPMNKLKPISELNESNMNEFLSFIFADPLQTSFTMQDLVNKFPELTKHPLTYGMTVLQRKYVGYFVDEEADDFDYAKISTKLDDLISSKFKSILYKYLINNDIINILSNSSKTDAVLVYAPKTTSGYYVFLPPKGVINESELQDKYQKFFKDKLAEYGVNSPAELSKKDKSKFFAEIKKEWPDAKID